MKQSGKFASFDGTHIHYTWVKPTAADPAPVTLVFCNDMGMDTSLWKHFLEYFEPSYPTLIWEYRGYGASQKPANTDNIRIVDHCHDLKGVLEELNIGPIVLFGHGIGVQVILEFTARYPDEVRGLIPICGSYKNPLDSLFHTSLFRYVFPSVQKVVVQHADKINPLWKMFSGTPVAEELARTLATNRLMTDRRDLKPFLKSLTRLDMGFHVQALKYACEHNAEEFLPKIEAPVLIIAGQWDPISPVSVSKKMAKLIPHAELLIIPHGSHCSMLDQPELVNLKTEVFLKKLAADEQLPSSQPHPPREASV